MITYKSLKELALVLSKITGYRYVSFYEAGTSDLFISLSKFKMRWYPSEIYQYGGFWVGDLNLQVLNLQILGDLPFLDWSKCQFDCKEEENGKEN